jgi:hypothetical protein
MTGILAGGDGDYRWDDLFLAILTVIWIAFILAIMFF